MKRKIATLKLKKSNYYLSRLLRTLGVLCGLFLAFFPKTSPAKVEARVKIGIEGRQIFGYWIPLEFTILKFPGREIKGHLVVRNIGVDYMHNIYLLSTYSYPVSIDEDTEFPLVLKFPIRIDLMASFLQFELMDGKGIFDSRILKLPEANTSRAVLVIGTSSERFQIISKILYNISIPLDPAELPKEEIYFDGVGGIILDNFSLDEIPEKSWQSLIHWLESGEVIILTPELVLLNKDNRRLAQLISVQVKGKVKLTSPEPIDQYFYQRAQRCLCEAEEKGTSQKISRLASVSLINLQIPKSAVWYSEQGFPVLVKQNHGFGKVWLFTIDLKETTFKEGADSRISFQENLWEILLGGILTKRNYCFDRSVIVPSEAKISDLIKFIAIYVAIFFLTLGLVNYLFLKKIDRREFILITIPIISVLFAIFAYWLGHIQRGEKTLITKSHLQVGQVGDPVVTVQSYIGVLVANSRPFSIKVYHTGGKGVFYEEEECENMMKIKKTYIPEYEYIRKQIKVSNLILPKWSMYFGMARSSFRYEQTIEGEARLSGRKLSGRVKNHLPFALQECMVIFNGGSVKLGRLEPGEERTWGLVIPPPENQERTCRGNICVLDLASKLNSQTKYEQYLDALNQFHNLDDQPLLIGWAEKPGPVQVEINSPAIHRPELNMFLFRIPIILDGETIRVVPGVSKLHLISGHLAFEEMGRLRKKGGIFTDFDFMQPEEEVSIFISMPFHINDPINIKSLKLVYRREPPPYQRKEKKWIAYYLWDWNKFSWTNVHSSDKYQGEIEIENPERFIRFPEGIVWAKAKITGLPDITKIKPNQNLDATRRSQTMLTQLRKQYIDVYYLDIDFEGRVIRRGN